MQFRQLGAIRENNILTGVKSLGLKVWGSVLNSGDTLVVIPTENQMAEVCFSHP